MQLKVKPKLMPRYWAAILFASMCGTNLGDVFPDVLKLSAPVSFVLLAVLFGLVVLVDGRSKRGSEASYWIAILLVRAAATNIADFSIDKQRLGYLHVGAALAAILAGLVALYYKSNPRRVIDDLPPTNGLYWLTMLTAGSLGTIVGDGVGHAFHSVQVGVPISAALSTAALAMILGARVRISLRTVLTYWVAVVAVRWWGTNVGDVLAFGTGLLVSLAVTGAALALVLFFWEEPAVRSDSRGRLDLVRTSPLLDGSEDGHLDLDAFS